jgi:hypothetical protein
MKRWMNSRRQGRMPRNSGARKAAPFACYLRRGGNARTLQRYIFIERGRVSFSHGRREFNFRQFVVEKRMPAYLPERPHV